MSEHKQKSRDRAAVFLKATFEALKDAGGSLPLRDVKAEVAKRVALTEHDLQPYEKTGYVRWESILHFYSIDCVKAGFLRKSSGRWYLTPEGEQVTGLSGPEILDKAVRAYREWKAAQGVSTPGTAKSSPSEPLPEVLDPQAERSFVFERAEGEARAEIEDHIKRMGPYEFQELVAAMLRGMAYTTPYVAPAGPDGGTDVLAYQDPLGSKTPHIRVQVKHRLNSNQKATRDEVAALRGVIRADREIGLFVSSSGFTSEAIREARQGAIHIELMTLEGLLEQWTSCYDKLSEEDRALLRLRRVYFLAPE